MPRSGDPYYDRKPVPDEFIEHVGETGMTADEEFNNRERKFSVAGGDDIRNFSNPKYGGKLDPYYQRKPVPETMIKDVGYTGLTKEEEYLNRERKYSINGTDVRRFSNVKGDPYYDRKPTHKTQIEGVGETGMSRAEEFEAHENKASLFDLSSDPFAQLSGQGHRASVSGPAIAAVASDARRRSSAVAPNQAAAARQATLRTGYDGGNNLAPIQSRADEEVDAITPSTSISGGVNQGPVQTTTTITTTTRVADIGSNATSVAPPMGNTTGHIVGSTGHTTFYDAATRDLAPHETE